MKKQKGIAFLENTAYVDWWSIFWVSHKDCIKTKFLNSIELFSKQMKNVETLRLFDSTKVGLYKEYSYSW